MRILDEDVRTEEDSEVDAAIEVWGGGVVPDEAKSAAWDLKWWVTAVASVLLAIVLGLMFGLNRADVPRPEEIAELLLSSQRPFHGRLSGQAYIPLTLTRSLTDSDVAFEPIQAEMERQRASDYLTGVIYLLGRDFDQAIQYLERAVRQVPEEAAIHNDLGVAYLEKGGRTLEDREQNLERAQAEFELSLSLDESFAPAVYNSALLYERTGRLGRSDNFSRRYLGMDSESDWAIEIRTRLEELR